MLASAILAAANAAGAYVTTLMVIAALIADVSWAFVAYKYVEQ